MGLAQNLLQWQALVFREVLIFPITIYPLKFDPSFLQIFLIPGHHNRISVVHNTIDIHCFPLLGNRV
jgi:hypothetical protein